MKHITVRTGGFEGPFDLLFHLIEKNKMDIKDIPVADLTEQYMEYIYAMNDMDMDNMSEFLLMMATLLEIKCKLLLPSTGDCEEEEDPRQILAQMLIEYKRFREASGILTGRAAEAGFAVYKERDDNMFDLMNKKSDEVYGNFSLFNLYEAFTCAIRNRPLPVDKPGNEPRVIDREIYSVKQKMDYIRFLLKTRRRISLSALFLEFGCKEEMAVTFIGLLQLIKDDMVHISQEQIFGDVMIENRCD